VIPRQNWLDQLGILLLRSGIPGRSRMSRISISSRASLAEQLDIVGQRYRGQQLLRGTLLWLGASAICTGVAVVLADCLGGAGGAGGRWLMLVLRAWAGVLLLGAMGWIGVPLLRSPGPLAVAALLESRLPGLHNGPTNALRLSADESLRQSGWREAIVGEIEQSLQQRPLAQATPWTELRAPAVGAGAMVLLLGFGALLFPAGFAHGWQQMFHPGSFVPRTGAARVLAVHPGDSTLIAGQPLDISADVALPTALADTAAAAPTALLYLDNADAPTALRAAASRAAASSNSAQSVTYSEHLDHVDKTFRYRLEIGGTQSPWYTATVVQQVRLTSMTLKMSPPPYLRASTTVQRLTAAQLAAVPLATPQGSTVQLSATVDVPVGGALLQRGQDAPAAMNASTERTSFTAVPFVLSADTTVALLLTDGASQVIATLPADPFTLHAIADAAPTVQMQWPSQDVTVAPGAPLLIRAHLADDHGLTAARLLLATDASAPLAAVASFSYANRASADLQTTLDLPAAARWHGNVIRVQVEATDNRQLGELGPQTTASPVVQISFQDPAMLAQQQQADGERLAAVLLQMLKTQQDLAEGARTALSGAAATQPAAVDNSKLQSVRSGQADLRTLMTSTAATFSFSPAQLVVQKTLQVLALNPAKDAVDRCDTLLAAAGSRTSAAGVPAGGAAAVEGGLLADQRQIIETLQTLLSGLGEAALPTTAPATHRGGQIASAPEDFRKLDESLKQFLARQQRILDQTASLAKIPADNFSAADKIAIDQLRQQQDDLDAFLAGKMQDLSMLNDQDFSNAALVKDLAQVMTEITMARDALQRQAVSIAVPAEENGVELATEISTNLERWLSDSPDRVQWTQEDLPAMHDVPAPQLPTQLQDIVGKLMEQEEDLLDAAQDMSANITDSGDRGIGWDAADGPIADMSAKGVTGNALPNNNAMGGRSGEGRSGQSEGEFVGDSAIGKGGRRTPTRLDPTPFQQGQINDSSRDPTGGATGGGKVSGEGAAGLQGSVPTAVAQGMHRLATQQAQIRNAAERLNLQLGLSRYDHFKLTQSIMLMRRMESDLDSNRYQTALRSHDVLLDDLSTSRLLLAGQVHVQQDTTPTTSLKLQQQLDDAAKADLPPAWSEPLKQYYRKLAG
jgi:hypothetical protein